MNLIHSTKDRSLCALFSLEMLQSLQFQNICRPETPTVIAPYLAVLEICFAQVWLEQATLSVFISTKDW